MTVSTMRLALDALSLFASGGALPEKITYRMEGKLNGPVFGSTSFHAAGEFTRDATFPEGLAESKGKRP